MDHLGLVCVAVFMASGAAVADPAPKGTQTIATESDPCGPSGVVALANRSPKRDAQVLATNKLRRVALAHVELTLDERRTLEAGMKFPHAPGAVGTDWVTTIQRDGKDVTGVVISRMSACMTSTELFGASKDGAVYRIDGNGRLYWVEGDDPAAPRLDARQIRGKDGSSWSVTDRVTGTTEHPDRVSFVCRTPRGDRPCVVGPDQVLLYVLPPNATYHGAISDSTSWKRTN